MTNPDTMQNAYGLIIGVSAYKNIPALPKSVINDANAIYDILVDEEYCAYDRNNVKMLLDEDATKDNILDAFEDLADQADENATVFIYLSSHGGRIPAGPKAGEYILPVNVAVDSFDSVARTAISGRDFTDLLGDIRARKMLVLFDCCHSGGIGRVSGEGGDMKSGLSEDLYDKLKEGKGRVIIASCRGTEESYILAGAENSIFTTHIVEGLKGEIPSDDGVIRVFDLFEYIQPEVTASHPKQHPVFKAELEENFPIAIYQGGTIGNIQRVERDFRYDVYISYADEEPDADWVWDELVPQLEDAGLKIAVSEDVMEPGVARVVSMERGLKMAKRTLIVLSPNYFGDKMAQFENTMSLTMSIEEGKGRLFGVRFGEMNTSGIPFRLSENMISHIDFTRSRMGGRHRRKTPGEYLAEALKEPVVEMFDTAYDVYLSYVETDRGWVTENLLPILGEANLNTVVTDSASWPGKPANVPVDQGLLQSKFVLAIISPDYATEPELLDKVIEKTTNANTGETRLEMLMIEEGDYPEAVVLGSIDLTNPRRAARRIKRLILKLADPGM